MRRGGLWVSTSAWWEKDNILFPPYYDEELVQKGIKGI